MRYRVCFIAASVFGVAGCEFQRLDPGDVAEGQPDAPAIVTVQGRVDEFVGPRTFSLENSGPDLEPHLTVVSRKHLPPTVVDDSRVRVTGVVHEVGVKELEKLVGFDFDAEMEAKLGKKKRFLVATLVQVIDAD